MASRRNGTLYTGVTASLERRVLQHREGSGSEFVKRYGCRMLVWYERYEGIVDAIAREKQIKAGSRRAKLALIESMNPDWLDLYRHSTSKRHRQSRRSERSEARMASGAKQSSRCDARQPTRLSLGREASSYCPRASESRCTAAC